MKSVCNLVFYNSVSHVPVTSVPVCPASSGDCLPGDLTSMPSRLASAKLGMSPESYEHGEQWSQPLERLFLSPEACLFIPGQVEHGYNGAVRAGSEQGQSSDGQFSVVSRQLSSGMQSHTYERAIILSR